MASTTLPRGTVTNSSPDSFSLGPGSVALDRLIKNKRADLSKINEYKNKPIKSAKEAKEIGELYYDPDTDEVKIIGHNGGGFIMEGFSSFGISGSFMTRGRR